MEKIVEIGLWSDNFKGTKIMDILHDMGLKTAGMHREIIGERAEEIEWARCKRGELSALVVDLFGDTMKTTVEHMHTVADVKEKPLFLYRVNIVADVPDKVEEESKDSETSKEENKMEINATLNIGCTTKDGAKLDEDFMVNEIGYYTDCTITKAIEFYKGQKENSLKVEIYATTVDNAVNLASYFARIFTQECVALTIKDKTHFITSNMSDNDFFDIVIDFEKH